VADSAVYLVAVLMPLVFGVCLRALARRRRRSTQPQPWRVVAAGNVLVLLLLLAVAFLLGESYFRFVYDGTDSFSETRTSKLWFDRHFERNNAGFRDNVDYSFRLTPGRRRVSFIGDSFTAGHGIPDVENRFANRVRRLAGGHWDVQVLAEAGRDTGAELKLIRDLREVGYQFDTIVLVYCLNDVNDTVAEAQSHPQSTESAPRPPGFLVEHSFLINTLYYRLRARLRPETAGYYDSVRTAYDGATWTEQQSRLIEMRDLSRTAGGRLVVVLFPFVHGLGPTNGFRDAHKALDQFWADAGVPCLDLLPIFESHAGERLTVSRYDAHPNERAHALAATAIYEWLQAMMEPP
jgi:lysophospholipase L1-like esterase